MTINTRSVQLAAYRLSEQQITDLFETLIDRITGILVREADADGLISAQRTREIRDTVQQVVEGYFVQRVNAPIAERELELEHLNSLIDKARAELDDATQRQRTRLLGRLSSLTDRLNLLAGGIVLRAFGPNGQPATEYARIIYTGTSTAVEGVIDAHAVMMEQVLANDAALLQALATPPNLAAMEAFGDGVLTWADTRGYVLSDRIWSTGEATAARIDAIVRDGIMQGRAAVDIARDLEYFLRPTRRTVPASVAVCGITL